MIVAYIWNLRYSHGGAWLWILGLMLLSHLVRRENAYSLGFRTRHMGECWRDLAPALAVLTLFMLACGTLLHTMRPIGVAVALASWAAYVPWGVFQQYALNGYFLNRFHAVMGRRAASLLAAARSGDVTDLMGHKVSLETVRAWVADVLDVSSWPILKSITAPAGIEAEDPVETTQTPGAVPSGSAMAALLRLRVASLDRLVREAARVDLRSSRSSVLAELERATDRVQWFGTALVCARGDS